MWGSGRGDGHFAAGRRAAPGDGHPAAGRRMAPGLPLSADFHPAGMSWRLVIVPIPGDVLVEPVAA